MPESGDIEQQSATEQGRLRADLVALDPLQAEAGVRIDHPYAEPCAIEVEACTFSAIRIGAVDEHLRREPIGKLCRAAEPAGVDVL